MPGVGQRHKLSCRGGAVMWPAELLMSFKLRYICWPLRVSALYDLKFYKACCNRSYQYGGCVAWCRCCGICLMAKAKLICVSVRPRTPYEARLWLGPAQIASMAGPGTQFLHGRFRLAVPPWLATARLQAWPLSTRLLRNTDLQGWSAAAS